MSFLCKPPSEHTGTMAELHCSLISVENEQDASMQTIARDAIYPSIEFEPVPQVTADYAHFTKQEPNLLETMYDHIKRGIQEQWEQNLPLIEATPLYQHGQQLYNKYYVPYTKTTNHISEHPLFNTKNTNTIRCVAWHPHLDMMAVAHHDHHVYIYEKKETEWHCQVIAHQHMKDITCMEWKNKASGLLAVGCQQGVCVWTLERNEFTSKRPRFHPLASMQYLQYPGHDSISSLTWDPTPASYLLAVASAVSSTLVIHDVQLNQTVPLKRFGKGNILLRWSPNGEFLFEGGSAGTSRMWDTSDWTSKLITNPPGLWIQAACWSPDNRTLLYTMCGKDTIHALFLTGKRSTILDVQVLPASDKDTFGGVIRDIAMDKNGKRLAVAYEDSPLIALYSVKRVSPLDIREEQMLFPIGHIRGAKTTFESGSMHITAQPNTNPLAVRFSLNYKRGAVMAVAWDNGTITFVTHTFLTDAELKSRII